MRANYSGLLSGCQAALPLAGARADTLCPVAAVYNESLIELRGSSRLRRPSPLSGKSARRRCARLHLPWVGALLRAYAMYPSCLGIAWRTVRPFLVTAQIRANAPVLGNATDEAGHHFYSPPYDRPPVAVVNVDIGAIRARRGVPRRQPVLAPA